MPPKKLLAIVLSLVCISVSAQETRLADRPKSASRYESGTPEHSRDMIAAGWTQKTAITGELYWSKPLENFTPEQVGQLGYGRVLTQTGCASCEETQRPDS